MADQKNLPIKMAANGRLSIPAKQRKALGLEKGGIVVSAVENGELRIRTMKAVLDELRERLAQSLRRPATRWINSLPTGTLKRIVKRLNTCNRKPNGVDAGHPQFVGRAHVPARRTGRSAAEAAIAARGSILSVNLAEVMGRLVRNGADRGVAADTLLALPLIVIDLDAHLAIEAGAMLAQTRPFGLSLGDRACLALAKREGLPALTADRSWMRAAPLVGIEVRLIR